MVPAGVVVVAGAVVSAGVVVLAGVVGLTGVTTLAGGVVAAGAVVLAGVLVSVGVVVSACEASVDNANTAPANTNALMDFFMCCLWLRFSAYLAWKTTSGRWIWSSLSIAE